jgi:GNAT superfamily N-acetyltransferase
MTAPVVVRPVARADLAAVMRFIRDLAAYERLAEQCVASEADIEAALLGSPPRLHAILAEAGAEAVGLATWCHTFSTFAGRPCLYVEDLFVDPPYRGRGVARRLLGEAARRAIADGCVLMEWKVLHWNEPALGLYRALGAKPVEDWMVQRLSGPDLTALAA